LPVACCAANLIGKVSIGSQASPNS
jgi:hypothetical protein